MSIYITTSVVWQGSQKENVVKTAKKHFNLCNREDITNFTEGFFESVISGKSYFEGHKGDIWMYGGVFTSTVNVIIDELQPFFTELYEKGIIYNKSRIIFFEQTEQHNDVEIYQIFLTNIYFDMDDERPVLDVQVFKTNKWYWIED